MIHAFIDGFNFYHVIDDYFQRKGENLKNLDYRKMMAEVASVPVEEVQIHFFTAKPKHLSFDKNIRHEIYTSALKSTGAIIYEGRFKTELVTCKQDCRLTFDVWKEKQTDVAVGVHLLHQVHQNPEDRFYLLTMDTDQIPVARLLQQNYHKTPFFWVIPPGKTAPGEAKEVLFPKQFIYLGWKHLRNNQFDPEVLKRKPVKT